MRLYEMFIGDFEKSAPWSTASVRGCRRFLERVYAMSELPEKQSDALTRSLHKTIKKVSDDIENMKFNTAIAAMMSFVNDVYDNGGIPKEELKTFVLLLCPFAPHLAEELWERLGGDGFASLQPYPTYDASMLVSDTAEVAVQLCGKFKGTVTVPVSASEDEVWDAVTAAGCWPVRSRARRSLSASMSPAVSSMSWRNSAAPISFGGIYIWKRSVSAFWVTAIWARAPIWPLRRIRI